MKKSEIQVGGLYLAKVAGKITTVRVDQIRECGGYDRDKILYDVTNLKTGRKTTFRSAAKFRASVRPQPPKLTEGMRLFAPATNADDAACIRCGRLGLAAHTDGSIYCPNCDSNENDDHPTSPASESVPTEVSSNMKCEICRAKAYPTPTGWQCAAYSNHKCPLQTEDEQRSDPTAPATTAADNTSTSTAQSAPTADISTSPTTSSEDEERLPFVGDAESGSLQAHHTLEDAQGVETEPTQQEQSTSPTTSVEDEQRSDPTQGMLENTTGLTTTLSPSITGPTSSLDCASATTANTIGSSAAQLTPTISLAAKIAAARNTRAVGDRVAGMVPNDEQEAIIAAAVEHGLRALVVAAGAGAGKTATLKMLEQMLPGRGQYAAFNTSLVAESKAKFVKAACNTTHSLAFRAVGKQYQHRLGGERVKSWQVAKMLGIETMQVVLPGMGAPEMDAEGKPTGKNADKVKTLHTDFLAGQVLGAVKKFCQSADREITEKHFKYIDGIDVPDADGKRGHANNDRVHDYLLPYCHKAWADLTSINGQLPFAHDNYVKLWQLGVGSDRPVIAADYILLDEAQDTAPVFLDVIKQQTHALLVLVGDSNQSIYEWRGAVDAMKAFAGAPRRLLSQSYRFGQAIADVANTILATLDEPTDLVMRGNPAIPSRVDHLEPEDTRCYLYRTNAGAVGRVMHEIEAGRKPHLIGGGADVVAWCQAAMDLQAKRGTRHPELCCFDTWAELVEYSKTNDGSDMRLMVKLVTDFGAGKIHAALKDMPKEAEADVVVSTAHKSKGREWDTVQLGQDFPTVNKMQDSDRRLLYVAATRAKLVLDVSECPPFCGGKNKGGGEDGEGGSEWIPGLRIEYTKDMPTRKELQAYIDGCSDNKSVDTMEQPSNGGDTTTTTAQPQAANGGNGQRGEYSWCKDGDRWCVRGPHGTAVGSCVTVTRRNGTSSEETVRTVVRRYPDNTVYGI